MGKLIEKSPAAGLLPYKNAGCILSELALGQITSIAPYSGQHAGVENEIGMALPEIGRSVESHGREIVWFSQGQFLMIGAERPSGLDGLAALTDQSDAWCALAFSGPLADDVLARLVPVDVRARSFEQGHVLRSQLGHMPLHLTRTGNDSFRLMSFRSMAGTMVHEITRALDFLVARG